MVSAEQHVAVGGLQCQNCHGDVATYSVGRIAPVEEINELRDKFPGIMSYLNLHLLWVGVSLSQQS